MKRDACKDACMPFGERGRRFCKEFEGSMMKGKKFIAVLLSLMLSFYTFPAWAEEVANAPEGDAAAEVQQPDASSEEVVAEPDPVDVEGDIAESVDEGVVEQADPVFDADFMKFSMSGFAAPMSGFSISLNVPLVCNVRL